MPMAVELAKDKCGSHVIEACYRHANVQRKKALAAELGGSYNQLRQSHFGAIVCQRCKVEQCVPHPPISPRHGRITP